MQKGVKGINPTQVFFDRFLRDKTLPVTITVDQFDRFAEQGSYYSRGSERDTVNQSRNRLRSRINATAVSPAWLQHGGEVFNINVSKHGKSYVVTTTQEAYQRRSRRLPSQVRSLVHTKRTLVRALFEKSNIAALSPHERDLIVAMERKMIDYEQTVAFHTDQANNEFRALQLQLTSAVPAVVALVEFTENDESSNG